MADAVTYSPTPPIEGKKFVCKRCSRVYAYPAPKARPIRCECGRFYSTCSTIHASSRA